MKIPLLSGRAIDETDTPGRPPSAVVNEAFVDRAYRKDGTLVPRSEPNAVIHDVQSAVQRAVMLVRMRSLTAQDGSEVRINAHSLCVHGDNPDSLAMLRNLRARLESAGITVTPFAA